MVNKSGFKGKFNFSNADPEDMSRLLNLLVASIDDSITPLSISPLAATIMVKNVILKAGQLNYISHNFGMKPNGYSVAKSSEFGMVKLSQENNNQPDKILILESTMDMVVDLWIY